MRTVPLFLLDTNVVSELRKPSPDARVVSWVEAAPTGSLAISWSTVFELQFGVENARKAGSHRADAYESALRDLIEDPRFRILRPTTDAARIRARMHATPALGNFLTAHPGSRKRATGEDLTIAATAIAAGAIIVTSNVRDFAAIGRHFPLPGLLEPGSGDWAVPPDGGAATARARPHDRTGKVFRGNPTRSCHPPAGTVRPPTAPGTSRVEVDPSSFRLEEALDRLKKHSAGPEKHTSLNCGPMGKGNRKASAPVTAILGEGLTEPIESIVSDSPRIEDPAPGSADGKSRRTEMPATGNPALAPSDGPSGVPGKGGRHMTNHTRSASNLSHTAGLRARSLTASIAN